MKTSLPSWLKQKISFNSRYLEIKRLLEHYGLNTVCQSALCPNISHCFGNGTATFLIMGKYCTRNCRFCAVDKGSPEALPAGEPENIAKMVQLLNLSYVVITSVTRDDLPDGGAEHFAQTITALKELESKLMIEVLIPDFGGSVESLKTVINASPDILNHNVETIPRLYPDIRPMADYKQSLKVLRNAKKIDDGLITKSGIMVGLGETFKEILKIMEDLRSNGCEIVTIGQYLAPSKSHYPVVRYYTPEEFSELKKEVQKLGFRHVECAPLVRSSFHAEDQFKHLVT